MKIRRAWVTLGAIVIVPLLLCVVVSLFLFRVDSTFSLFWIKDLGVCQRVSPKGQPIGITNTFSTDTERIYAFFTLDSNMPIRLKIRWYYEDQLILEQEELFHSGGNYVWIATQASSGFKEGEYQVKVGDKVADFKIEESKASANYFYTRKIW